MSFPTIQSPLPRTSREKCPFLCTTNQDHIPKRIFLVHWEENCAERGEINSLLGQNLRRKFQPCWHKDKNDENEKKKWFSSRTWKRRQLPLSYTNKNARHRLFCSFTHPTSIDLAKVWIRPSSSQPPPPLPPSPAPRQRPGCPSAFESPAFSPGSCWCKWKITGSFGLCTGTPGSHRIKLGWELGFFLSPWMEGEVKMGAV